MYRMFSLQSGARVRFPVSTISLRLYAREAKIAHMPIVSKTIFISPSALSLIEARSSTFPKFAAVIFPGIPGRISRLVMSDIRRSILEMSPVSARLKICSVLSVPSSMRESRQEYLRPRRYRRDRPARRRALNIPLPYRCPC